MKSMVKAVSIIADDEQVDDGLCVELVATCWDDSVPMIKIYRDNGETVTLSEDELDMVYCEATSLLYQEDEIEEEAEDQEPGSKE